MGTVEAAVECRHGIEFPGRCCAICRGSWDHVVRSRVTGATISGPDLIAWFVPTCDYSGEGRSWVDFIGVKQSEGMPRVVEAASPHDQHVRDWLLAQVGRFDGSGTVEDLGVVGPPLWYERLVHGTVPIGAAVDYAGLDWASVAEAHVADILAWVSDDIEVRAVRRASEVSPQEASALYVGAAMAALWDQGERLREWRRITGRSEGGEVFA